MYRTYGTTSLYEFLGDFVVYRNLVPMDARLPAFEALQSALGLDGVSLPRKAELNYGRVVAEMLRQARALDGPSAPASTIQRLIYIGDTRMNDGTAFRNLCEAGGWPGWAFIGHEALSSPPSIELESLGGDVILSEAEGSKGRLKAPAMLYLANRWSALFDFVRFVEREGFVLDAGTAVVIDMDKTAIGARGRNDAVINAARVEGVRRTVADVLGAAFDAEAFRTAYDALNQSRYHAFTADNQDYLAYICLILGTGLFALDDLKHQVETGAIDNFEAFITRVERRRDELGQSGLVSIHDEVWRRVQVGDPTPFKAFRYNEYLTTVARFGEMPGEAVTDVLTQRIVITQEVREVARSLRERGALIFGVSDKPDEASLPRASQPAMQPLHHLETLAVGQDT
jgi:phosphoserine phosphatase